MQFDKNGKLIAKNLRKTIKHEEERNYDKDYYFDSKLISITKKIE